MAVSGGVDSVVLLDMWTRNHRKDELIVAHFDHGIRSDSADDAVFVHGLAERYGLQYETRREELGTDASEELARERRYAFLREVAKRNKGIIVTAHHADDVVETIAINVKRGTGWRGLAVLDSEDIERPLLAMRKYQLVAYANDHGLQWREDSTNNDTRYLRNAVREQLQGMSDDQCRLVGLYRARQVALKRLIDDESLRLTGQSPYSRYFFASIPDFVAIELLRNIFIREVGTSPARPARQRSLHALKTYTAGKRFEVGDGISLVFTKSTFVIEHKNDVIR